MEKKYNSSTLETNTENINIESTGTPDNQLKDHFKQDNIPPSADCNDLIDVANMDYHAVGKSYELKPGDDYTLATKINPNGGLKVDNDGLSLKIKTGNGIKTDSNGISIDPNNVLPKGMIMMFSGMDAPTGWAFCDGNNGTPDLRSRFVMCGETISETGQSSSKANGSGTKKIFSKNTTSTTVSVNVTVENTTLTEAQIPSHKHIGGMSYYGSYGMKYGLTHNSQTEYQINNPSSSSIWRKPSYGDNYYANTSNTGGGQGHNHRATASSPSHNHSVDIIPPYYLLAFIMKL
ncbi:tail fiber protein [Photorhabdus luminescens]|uniref:Tail fiber protein n=1 Tax=Photorhabdus luminescens subsp. sonorensis TaxID=1173677 RepID=A0A5C4REV4_PHOLU|nr:tail fiber protein [Photorhabdus luminescens]TNH42319.1 tail fiber protein [Photorhabdus luminescens subsp. sonorensis]